jgi:excisionase family DNA binding protein
MTNANNNLTGLLTIDEVADYLGVSTRTVRRLVALRAIAFVRINRQLRFRLSDVDAYVESQLEPAVFLGEIAS